MFGLFFTHANSSWPVILKLIHTGKLCQETKLLKSTLSTELAPHTPYPCARTRAASVPAMRWIAWGSLSQRISATHHGSRVSGSPRWSRDSIAARVVTAGRHGSLHRASSIPNVTNFVWITSLPPTASRWREASARGVRARFRSRFCPNRGRSL